MTRTLDELTDFALVHPEEDLVVTPDEVKVLAPLNRKISNLELDICNQAVYLYGSRLRLACFLDG